MHFVSANIVKFSRSRTAREKILAGHRIERSPASNGCREKNHNRKSDYFAHATPLSIILAPQAAYSDDARHANQQRHQHNRNRRNDVKQHRSDNGLRPAPGRFASRSAKNSAWREGVYQQLGKRKTYDDRRSRSSSAKSSTPNAAVTSESTSCCHEKKRAE